MTGLVRPEEAPLACCRSTLLEQAQSQRRWDVLIVGGGATGLGCAVDAAQRGYRTLLVEQHDFAKGTSSRSTKLIHGGLRYLANGQLRLVYEALRERHLLRQNAPGLVHPLPFAVPFYRWFHGTYYRLGIWLYDRLAADRSFRRTMLLNAQQTRERIPGLRCEGLRGSVLYYDGQFDDARLAIALVRTAIHLGACVLNYVYAEPKLDPRGRVVGLLLEDRHTGRRWEVEGRVVINATGIFADELRLRACPQVPALLVYSQGTHLVLPGDFLGGTTALLVPKTPDGRVVFAIPWYGKLLVGTTDEPVASPQLEPRPKRSEVEYLLTLINRYLTRTIGENDILSLFSGQRPLLRKGQVLATSRLSRDFRVEVLPSGLVTVTGGKWTTYRLMAQRAVDRAALVANLPRAACQTGQLRLVGGQQDESANGIHAVLPGADAHVLQAWMAADPQWGEKLHERLPYIRAHVKWAIEYELACTVEDVLARRTRALLLDCRAACEAAPLVARLMALCLGKDELWQKAQLEQFQAVAAHYHVSAVQLAERSSRERVP